jgi:hypothetical protein
MENLSFGDAIEAVKDGQLIARSGWNGKKMFVFARPEDELTVDFIINKVKSLPQALKDYYRESTFTKHDSEDPNDKGAIMNPTDVKIKFTAYLCLKAADDTIVNGWLASQSDMLATDWYIVK